MTSRDVVNSACRILQTRKIGHAGTLDPMATGVLVLAVGPATRLVAYIHQLPKTYRASFRLGAESSTEDIWGEVQQLENPPVIPQQELEKVLPRFLGAIQQVPPVVSAIKIEGKRAYQLARQGEAVKLDSRLVHVHRLDLIEFDYPSFGLEIECSSGTYIRSLGRDIGRNLNSCAIMTELKRTAIGPFHSSDSVTLDDLEREQHRVLKDPIKALANLPKTILSVDQVDRVRNGGLLIETELDVDPGAQQSEDFAACDEEGRLIAILERMKSGKFKPAVNFANYWYQAGN